MAGKHNHRHHGKGHTFGKVKKEVKDTIVKTVADSGDAKTMALVMEAFTNKPHGPTKTLLKIVAASGNPGTITSVIEALKGLEGNPFAIKIAGRFEESVTKKGLIETKVGESSIDTPIKTGEKEADDGEGGGNSTDTGGATLDPSVELHTPDIIHTDIGGQ